MKLSMIENYPNPRRMHCESGVLVNLLEYYGYKISEPMVFGIGGGLYFLYFPWMKLYGFVLPVLRSKPTNILRHFSPRMHLGYHEKSYGNDKDRAAKELDELVAKGVPVGLVVNLIGLKYLNDIGFELDYNGHHIVVIGKEGSQYIIADMDYKLPNDDYVTLDEARMPLVRFRDGISAPHGRMFYIDPLPANYAETVDLKPAIISGLKETCRNMLSIPMPWFGTKGIHFMAKDMRKWEKKHTPELIDLSLLWYYRLIEQAGTGGSGYRYIFADFLKESADIFQSEALAESSDIMRKAADTWRVFTVDCNRYLDKKGVTLNEMADVIDEAGRLEHDALANIKKKFLKTIK